MVIVENILYIIVIWYCFKLLQLFLHLTNASKRDMSLPSTKSANTPLKSVEQNVPKSPSSVKKKIPSTPDAATPVKKHVSKTSGDLNSKAMDSASKVKTPRTPSASTAPSVSDIPTTPTPKPKSKTPVPDAGDDAPRKIVKKKKKLVEQPDLPTDQLPQANDTVKKAKSQKPPVPDAATAPVDQVKENATDAPKIVKKKKKVLPKTDVSDQPDISKIAEKKPDLNKAGVPDIPAADKPKELDQVQDQAKNQTKDVGKTAEAPVKMIKKKKKKVPEPEPEPELKELSPEAEDDPEPEPTVEEKPKPEPKPEPKDIPDERENEEDTNDEDEENHEIEMEDNEGLHICSAIRLVLLLNFIKKMRSTMTTRRKTMKKMTMTMMKRLKRMTRIMMKAKMRKMR
jgi:hypothetical protein